MIGIWIGTYKHESKRISEQRQNQLTKFEIRITDFDGVRFSGEVEDDIESGGTRGTGKIEGKLVNNKIKFIKKMPIQTFVSPDGRIAERNQPHRKIYYSGILENNSVKGTWKFRFGIGTINNQLVIFPQTKGIWEMKKVL